MTPNTGARTPKSHEIAQPQLMAHHACLDVDGRSLVGMAPLTLPLPLLRLVAF